MTQRKHQHRENRLKRLRYAGYGILQQDDGTWRVRTPYTEDADAPEAWLPKTYKQLTTAVSAGIREIERLRAKLNAHGKLSPEREKALQSFDRYPEETE